MLAAVALALLLLPAADKGFAADKKAPAAPIYLIANQDIGFPSPNAIALYLAQDTQLTFQASINSGGYGIQGGYFGTSRVNSIPSTSAPCVYVSDSGSNDIASYSLQSQAFVGNFVASQGDDGSTNGIGLAVNSNYLYASFSASQTLAAFALQGGCGLSFLGELAATGLQGGSITGMAVSDKILVVAYGDGSIQSFSVTGGIPVPNNDLQNATGFVGKKNPKSLRGVLPSAVDLTRDGRFAIFGDISPETTVEVSSLASGKLAPTTVYTVGSGIDAGNIRLSPDETLLYAVNSESGTVTAAFFNAVTGKVSKGCASATLQGFNGRPWYGSVAARDTTGTGNVLYVAEFGRDYLEINHGPVSTIGILNISSNGVACALAETPNSPVLVQFPGTLSLGVYPPRPF